MTGEHHNWHRRWIVDLAACTATHDSGLIVRAIRAPDNDATDYRPVNLDAWQQTMLATMPLSNLLPHAQRLMREAIEVYQHALERQP